MMALDLEPIKAREAVASPGPWDWWGGGPDAGRIFADARRLGDLVEVADAAFAAHARTDMPALVAEVERLRGVAERLRAERDTWRERANNAEAAVDLLVALADTLRTRIGS